MGHNRFKRQEVAGEVLFLTLANRVRELFGDLAVRLGRRRVPGPDAILFLEKQLGGIGRHPDEHEIIERAALVAAIYELGGNDRAAAGTLAEA